MQSSWCSCWSRDFCKGALWGSRWVRSSICLCKWWRTYLWKCIGCKGFVSKLSSSWSWTGSRKRRIAISLDWSNCENRTSSDDCWWSESTITESFDLSVDATTCRKYFHCDRWSTHWLFEVLCSNHETYRRTNSMFEPCWCQTLRSWLKRQANRSDRHRRKCRYVKICWANLMNPLLNEFEKLTNFLWLDQNEVKIYESDLCKNNSFDRSFVYIYFSILKSIYFHK